MSAIDRLGIDAASFSGPQEEYSNSQQQTQSTFAFKWSKRDTYESPAVQDTLRCWLHEKYCSGDKRVLTDWLEGGRKLILDAGCGAGFSAGLFFGDELRRHDYLGVDISDSCNVARTRFSQMGYPGDFIQASLDDNRIPKGAFDIVFSEGVLHHTDNTQRSISVLAEKLKKGGRFLFYVYAKKAVIREFTDDYIRQFLKPLSDEEAWEALYPLTKLGVSLGRINQTIEVEEDIPCLGIKKGKLDLQRFFYWNVCKAFFRPDYSLDEMNHLNFDWFRPLNCHRQTPEEVRSFCDKANLEIERMNVEEAGITVVAKKL